MTDYTDLVAALRLPLHGSQQAWIDHHYARAEKAEAEVERLKGVLQQIGEGTRDGQHCALIANVALEAKP